MRLLKTLAAGAAAAVMSAVSLTGAYAADKITLAVNDVEGLEALQQEFGPFKSALEKVTGLTVEFFPVGSRTAAVEAMNAGQADFVLTGPAEYVIMKEIAKAEVVAAWQRPEYYSQIVVLSNGPVRSVEDLKGKKVSFGAVGSTSQHLGPAQVLTDFGLKYGVDYDPQIIKLNVALEALQRGDIAAIGMNATHLERAREQYPDVAFTVVARGRDLPNDIMVVRPGVDAAVVAKVREAFTEHTKELWDAVTSVDANRKYIGGTFIADVKDADYDYVRSMYRTIGVESFDKFVE